MFDNQILNDLQKRVQQLEYKLTSIEHSNIIRAKTGETGHSAYGSYPEMFDVSLKDAIILIVDHLKIKFKRINAIPETVAIVSKGK